MKTQEVQKTEFSKEKIPEKKEKKTIDIIVSFLRQFLAFLVWAYFVTKLFIFDIDIYFVQKIFPGYIWIFNYKFVIIIIIIILTYIRRFIFIFKPTDIFQFYIKIFSTIRTWGKKPDKKGVSFFALDESRNTATVKVHKITNVCTL